MRATSPSCTFNWKTILYRIILTSMIVAQTRTQQLVESLILDKTGSFRSCPSREIQESAKRNLSETILFALQNPACGEIGWTKVFDLNMSNTSEQCPSPWRQYSLPARSCSLSSSYGCQGITVPVPARGYSQVCGRAIGYAKSSPDGFRSENGIDQEYLDGVSLTHGSPRQHIWSLAAGHGGTYRCPCDNSNLDQAPLPPSFVGENWFCDGNYNGALWDGQDCTSSCCTFNSPPYFTTILPEPIIDDIEIRICTDQRRRDEAVNLGLLQLYVK